MMFILYIDSRQSKSRHPGMRSIYPLHGVKDKVVVVVHTNLVSYHFFICLYFIGIYVYILYIINYHWLIYSYKQGMGGRMWRESLALTLGNFFIFHKREQKRGGNHLCLVYPLVHHNHYILNFCRYHATISNIISTYLHYITGATNCGTIYYSNIMIPVINVEC